MGKRKASVENGREAREECKMMKAMAEWQKAASKCENDERVARLAKILKSLQDMPVKIKQCRIACEGDMFVPGSHNYRDPDKEFSATNKWLFKIPKSHFMDGRLRLWFGISQASVECMNKHNKQSIHQVIYRATFLKGMSPVTVSKYEDFDGHIVNHMELVLGKPLPKVPVDPKGVIDWAEFGIYKLVPTFGGDSLEEAVQHRYTEVLLNDRFKARNC